MIMSAITASARKAMMIGFTLLAGDPASCGTQVPTGTGGAGGTAGTGGSGGSISWPRLEASQIGSPILISNAFRLAEGPVWDVCGHRLLFSDVNGNVIHQLVPGAPISVFLSNSNYANGLAFDAQGGLLLAEMGGGRGGRITRLDSARIRQVLVDRNPLGGVLNTSDDLAIRSDGTIYFTDPIVSHGAFLGLPIGTYPLYRLEVGPAPRQLVTESRWALPNGVDFSPDEKTLYMVDYLGGTVQQFAVAADGALALEAPLATRLTNPDSACLDAAGNIYVGVSSGLLVLRPSGERVALIPIPSAQGTTNCGFGGEDGKTLYITAWTSLWRIPGMPIPGLDWTVNQRIDCAALSGP